MDRTYAYYPGCTLHATAREYDTSFRLVCQALGLELRELENWICCGASSAHATDHLLGVSLPAHTLQGAAKAGLPLMVPCAACYSRLKLAAHEMEDKTLRQQVAQALGEEIKEPTPVWHPLQVLAKEKISAKKSLAGLKVACYYGCLLVRPKGVMKFDDPENPQIMDRLLASLGAEAVPWGFKTECCGAGMSMPRQDMVLKLSYRILQQAVQAGADCVATACPLCHANLDLYQKKMAKQLGEGLNLPIFYFTQLVGLALGLPAQSLGFDRHFTQPMPLLRSKGLA